jgi:phosphoribosyl 1,2-cyclic phosphodiesterase
MPPPGRKAADPSGKDMNGNTLNQRWTSTLGGLSAWLGRQPVLRRAAGCDDFTVRFWGVRGSLATGGPETVHYGGNTSCVEMRCGDRCLIFDAGTGIRPLGESLAQRGGARSLDIFLSHTHHDHVCGLPFFRPFYDRRYDIRLWSGHEWKKDCTTEQAVDCLMNAPLFPIRPDAFRARVGYRDFTAGETITLSNEIEIRTVPLNHVNGATGYRVDFQGRSVCYLTDTEHEPGKPDRNILELIGNADIVIYDATYTDEEFVHKRGYGHSTWQEGLRLTRMANARRFVAFHHDPSHNDAFMDRVARDMRRAHPLAVVAREGMVLRP